MASVEETLALWAASLREIKQRIRPLFKQERVAENAGLFLEGLLGDEQRKTGWMRAEAAGDPGPWRQQAILGRRDWDADALRDIVRDYVIEQTISQAKLQVLQCAGFAKVSASSHSCCSLLHCSVAFEMMSSERQWPQLGVVSWIKLRRAKPARALAAAPVSNETG